MAKVNFTAGRVGDHKCDEGKSQTFLWDAAAPGLGLRATSTGAKSYIFQAKLNGQAIRITIGAPATWDIEQARVEARHLKVIIDQSKDPRQVKADGLAEEQAARDAIQAEKDAGIAANAAKLHQEAIERTERELIARDAWDVYVALPHKKIEGKKGGWGAQHRADHATAASAGGDACKIGDKTAKPAPLATLLALPLHGITAQVVQDWLTTECETRPTFAHNCFRKFRTFVLWCATQPEYADIVRSDCCMTKAVRDATPANKTKKSDRLQREQLPGWFGAVRQITNPVISAYLQTLLLTGARRGEIAVMKWSDIDLVMGEARIRDKVAGTRDIPLPPYVCSLLRVLPRRNQWVFSSPTAATGHIMEPRLAHTQALERAGVRHVSLHGLRRSFASLCEWVECPAGVSSQIQGHSLGGIREKHYIDRPVDLLRMWHVKIEGWILTQAGIDFVTVTPGLRVVTAA